MVITTLVKTYFMRACLLILILAFICCNFSRQVTESGNKVAKGVIIFHGDHFFIFKIKNKKMSMKNVTWPYLYSNLEHTGYMLNNMNFYSINKILPSFKGIRLNAESERVKKELKYLYVAPVNYSVSFLDTLKYNAFNGRKMNLHFSYNEVPYIDFKYQSYMVDTCVFSTLTGFEFSSDFSLPADSLYPLLEELPPSVFKNN